MLDYLFLIIISICSMFLFCFLLLGYNNSYRIVDKFYKIIIYILTIVSVASLLTPGVNFLFFKKNEQVIGLNTICYVDFSNDYHYHNKDCIKLDYSPRIYSLLDAICLGYGECCNCSLSYINDPCYVTEHGDCYHQKYCKYLYSSAIETTIYKATENLYEPCNVCYPEYIDFDCYITPYGKYFHKNSICAKNTERTETITEISVFRAKQYDCLPCQTCDVGELDIDYITKNDYKTSAYISLCVSLIMSVLILILYPKFSKHIKSNDKTK